MKKHGNIIVLGLTLFLFAYHVVQIILVLNDVFIYDGFIGDTFLVMFFYSIIVTLIIYYFKHRSKKNLSVLLLSVFTLSGYFVILMLFASAIGRIS